MWQQCRRSRKRKDRMDETQFSTKIGGKVSVDPSYFIL
jgi:hypothetical protein